MARVPYVDDEDLPAEYQGLTRTQTPREEMAEEYRHLLSTESRNVHRLVGHLPPVLAAFRQLGGTIREETGLDTTDRELVILGTARGLDCEYVWHQHVRIALGEGVARGAVLAVGERDPSALDDRQRAIVEYAVACARGEVDDATFDALAGHVDERTIVGISLFAGLYTMICRATGALGIDLEEPFVGWALEGV